MLKQPPLMSAGPSLPSRAFFDQLAHLGGDLQHALLVGVLEHRHHQAVRRVGRKADVEVLLVDQRIAVQAGVEVGELLQRRDHGLDHEGQHRDLDAGLLVLLVQLHAQRFELGDVGLVVVGDVRDQHPVAVQVGAADLLDAAEVLALDRAELGEVHLRPGQQAGECRRRPLPARPPWAPRPGP
jgi:hypothetical protein